MPRFTRRKALQAMCGAASLALAGCTERMTSGGADTPPPSSSTPTASPTATAAPETTTVDRTRERAKDQALRAEEEYITEQFENASFVEDWGLTDYVGWRKGATIINQSSTGVYVNVSHPFWYSTSEEEADVGTKATYRVTGDEVQRLSGTNVSLC